MYSTTTPIYKIEEFPLSANIYHLDGSKSVDSARVYKECNQNEFGVNCSGTCSTRGTFCERMLFCTSRDGCSCASGYTGQFCDQKCPLGTYGRDCQKKCGENCDSCDIHTGICLSGCKSIFILPNCTEKYPWLIAPPQLVSSNYHSVKLNVSFDIENIAGSNEKTPLYYQIVYKQASSNSDFNNLNVKKIGDSNYAIVNIDNLLLGTEYTFGAVVIADDGNFNDEDINTANYITQCLIPENIDYGIHLVKGAKYINVTWEKHNKKDILECEIVSYTLKLIFNRKLNMYDVAYTSSNKYDFDNLIPAHTYAIQVTAMTTLGPTEPSDLFYETTDVQGFISIRNITANQIDSDTILHLTWELNNANIDTPISYMVKYKINRHYSCSRQTVNSNWTKIIIENITECALDLIPNTQYVIKIEPITTGYTYGESENVIFVHTTTSTPNLAPVLDVSQPIYVNNQTASIKWYVDKEKCNKLNGFVMGFHVVLKNLLDATQIVKETEEPAVKYTNLNPNTDYELRVYIKTDKGFNVNSVLSVPFKTKSKYLPPVEELSVYKKISKTREIGLRWSYPNDTDMNGFIIQVNPNSQKTNVKQKTIEPLKCKAWPTMYCTTVDNLTRSTQYTIKILAKSEDYPSGVQPGSINFNTMDGTPDEPKNVKAIQVGTKNVTIEWDIPWMFNGALNSFIINVEEVSSLDVDSCCASFPVMELQVTEELPTYNYTINDLKPGSTYTIGVSSKTSWYSQANKVHVTTLVDTTAVLPSEVIENNSTETN
ncbi:uncharacterized protein LOC126832850 [Adelges cooleyi]|uniref:uncharacterized protein LOC126832850 n=1 Tax=Adelges cooleyi TaxID=133065 RepID=UPI002180653B|nr:uncharacterized protein LOC126832850 [Adelges cooleyi]